MYAVRIVVTGVVQGVGFRPFVNRIAVKSGVNGYVRNIGGAEVEIFIEGERSRISEFIKLFYKEKPPPALIDEVEIYWENPRGYRGFSILKSGKSMLKRSIIPPDLAICDECLREILDPRDRRYMYPFNSCAWCGPRFSMMYTVPYDRENTSMRKYRLCSDCLREYRDLNNVRRYHAQGISCPRDGPQLKLYSINGDPIETSDPIREAAKIIDEGYIVAVKGLGGYHLAALATDDDVVAKLRMRKKRPRKPFAVMVLDLDVAEKLVYIDDKARRLLLSPIRPIVLLPKRPDTPVSKLVSPDMAFEGIFTPYTGLHYILLMHTRDRFLIMTSGNRKGDPMCISEGCVFEKLRRIADYVLVHDREIVNRVDDSVVRFTEGEPVLLRRSRGYAPLWIKVSERIEKPVIAFGADIHSAAAIGFDDKVVLTQYIGDLESAEAANDLMKYLSFLIKNYGIDASESVVVVDKHPYYVSRNLGISFARSHGSRVIEIQHHYAHVLSTAADRGVEEPFIGIAIDGTGYGDDGAIWGGEIILVSSQAMYRRVGHLSYQPLESERAVIYPIRFFFSVLSRMMTLEEIIIVARKLGILSTLKMGAKEIEAIYSKVSRGAYINTSSTGRILDGVSAFLGFTLYRSYEGEPAIVLESRGLQGRYLGDELFAPKLLRRGGSLVIDTTPIYMDLINYGRKYRPEDIAYTIQYNLGIALGEAAAILARGLRVSSSIVVGGGAAVNSIIVKGIRRELSKHGLRLLLPRRVPANDGGIALGQVIAAARAYEQELN